MTHELKILPQYFEPVRSGVKTFEIRTDDRVGGFNVGDVLHLREWCRETEHYTGRFCFVDVTYVLPLSAIRSLCVMSVVNPREAL